MNSSFYLKTLLIQNFATFKNQIIKFRPGLNAIVGETGSGKSLVLDALELILGGRADKKVVRRETEYSLIEASFFCRDGRVKTYLEGEGFPIEGDDIIIKRVIYANGTTKNFINHQNCTVTFLYSFSKKYIDIVGQFENQKLLSEAYQLHLLDQFAKNNEGLTLYQASLSDLRNEESNYRQLLISKDHRDQRMDYLKFQLQEIDRLNPTSQDEEDLLKKKHIILNHERMQKLYFQAKENLEGADGQPGISGHVKFLFHLFTKNQEYFYEQTNILSEIEDRLRILMGQIELKLKADGDPSDLDFVLERLDLYQKIKKKFGPDIHLILQNRETFQQELKRLEELEINLSESSKNIYEIEKKTRTLADQLHQKRLHTAKNLSRELTAKVRSLKMTGATINLNLESHDELTETGITKVSFLAETNPGEGFFKIKDIASGGELSRILLSLRQILSAKDSISIFLFDEIDTGIGGETATCIGKALSEVAEHGQVIAITHLPQIAQFAELLVVVNKDIQSSNQESRTESKVKEIFGPKVKKEAKAMAQLA